jgi:hypothetical protein
MGVVATVRASNTAELEALLTGLVAQNLVQRRRGVPPLGLTRVRYAQEQPGLEEWLSAEDALRRGSADCEDLAAWLCADLIFAGRQARCVVREISPTLRHVVVECDGRIIDPSKALGMR